MCPHNTPVSFKLYSHPALGRELGDFPWKTRMQTYGLSHSSAFTFRVIERGSRLRGSSSHNSVGTCKRKQKLTFLGSDDEGLGGSVHQPAVPIDQVGHVLSDGQGRCCHCQRLKGEQTEKEPLLFSPTTSGTAARDIRSLDAVETGSGSETGLS